MSDLLITLQNVETGQRSEAGFRRSPVRIGRNALNDLAIDEGFVSQWHGVLRFDGAAMTYLDLGSTNGTELGGERLERNVERELDGMTPLMIGPIQLLLVRGPLADDQILSRRAKAFTLGGTARAAVGRGEGGTIALGAEMSVEDIAATLALDGAPPNMQDLMQMAERQKGLKAELRPLFESYEAARTSFNDAVARLLADLPPGEQQSQASLLATQFPSAFQQPELQGHAASASAGDDETSELVESLAPGASRSHATRRDMLERLGSVLHAFATAFIELELGQTQIARDLDLERGGAADLPQFDEPRELLAYLLDGAVDGRLRIDELSRSFADIALHQLGIVAGSRDGALAVLSQVSPHGIGAQSPGALVKTSFGLGDFLWPFSAAGNYYRYAAKHFELSTGHGYVRHLFGPTFSRAYHRIAGRRR